MLGVSRNHISIFDRAHSGSGSSDGNYNYSAEESSNVNDHSGESQYDSGTIQTKNNRNDKSSGSIRDLSSVTALNNFRISRNSSRPTGTLILVLSFLYILSMLVCVLMFSNYKHQIIPIYFLFFCFVIR